MSKCRCAPLKEAVDLDTGEILSIVQSDIRAPWKVICRSAGGASIVQYIDRLRCKLCSGSVNAIDGFSTFMCSTSLKEMYTNNATEYDAGGDSNG